MNNKLKLTSDQISDIPYVLFINDKGEGFTLNRQYKLQYPNIGDWNGLDRTVIKNLLPLAKKVEQGYPLLDHEAKPDWVHRGRVIDAGHEFKTYWFDQYSEKVQKAYYEPQFNDGVTYHFDKVSNITEELKTRKASQRAEITENHRKEFGIKKPFLSDGLIRFYLHEDKDAERDICRQWNDGWWTTERFTMKELDRVIIDIINHLQKDNTKGVFHISLEGQYCTCTSFEDAEAGNYEPWGDHFTANRVVTIVVK
jgi:hypothetical protein